jgi:formylglycine-generating enzyme required for sulfatase activity
MAGNVNEWVLDLYRPLTTQTLVDVENHDLNSFRGNDYQNVKRDQDGEPVEKDSLGRLVYVPVEDEEVANRDNYSRGRVYDYLDGDEESGAEYATNEYTLISDKARVYKGGSWADRAYWLSPGTRRFLDQDRASRTIGFRCAMVRVGNSSGVDDEQVNRFGMKPGKKNRRRSRR